MIKSLIVFFCVVLIACVVFAVSVVDEWKFGDMTTEELTTKLYQDESYESSMAYKTDLAKINFLINKGEIHKEFLSTCKVID